MLIKVTNLKATDLGNSLGGGVDPVEVMRTSLVQQHLQIVEDGGAEVRTGVQQPAVVQAYAQHAIYDLVAGLGVVGFHLDGGWVHVLGVNVELVVYKQEK